jgi:hypothetical protein
MSDLLHRMRILELQMSPAMKSGPMGAMFKEAIDHIHNLEKNWVEAITYTGIIIEASGMPKGVLAARAKDVMDQMDSPPDVESVIEIANMLTPPAPPPSSSSPGASAG